MPLLPGRITVPFGHPGTSSVYISGSEYTGRIPYYRFTKRLNEPGDFECEVWGLSGTDFDVVDYGKNVMLFDENHLFFKGEITKIEKDTFRKVRITGASKVAAILNRRPVISRNTYVGSTVGSIITNLASENLDGASPFIVNVGSVSNFGAGDTPTVRLEIDSRLVPLQDMVDSVNGDWWESYSGATYGADFINVGSHHGNTSFQATWNSGSPTQNINSFKKVDDEETIVNKVIVLGYGDGINQVSGVAEDASSQSTNGVFERVFVRKTITDSGWCGSIADAILGDLKDPPVRGTVVSRNPFIFTGVDLGDNVIVMDKQAEFVNPGSFRILQLERSFGRRGYMSTAEVFEI